MNSKKHSNREPNLIIIMADQLRHDVLGKGITPNIDGLAAEGITFDRAYCNCPLCVPSRGSFFTGTMPAQNGSRINPWTPDDAPSGDVHAGIPNLFEMLEQNWEVIHSGKQHLYTEGGKLEDKDQNVRWVATEKSYAAFLKENGKRAPGGPAFRTEVPEMVSGKYTRVTTYSTPKTGIYPEDEKYFYDRYYTDRALTGLRERKGDKPLFLNMMFLAPHPPFEIPEKWYSLIDINDVILPDNVGIFYPRQSPLQMYNITGIVGSRYTREEWRESWRVYLGLTAMLDSLTGEIIDELKRQGLYDNSIIIFTSDHGEMLGSHALFQKMCMYEESVHVPLYIKLPKGKNARMHIGNPVSLIDVLPTICEMLKVNVPESVEGRSLVPLINGIKEPPRDIFIQYDGNGSLSNFQRCIISNGKKLIVDLFKDEAFFELYDIEHDIEETDNLLFHGDQWDNVAQELYRKLLHHMRTDDDSLSMPIIDLKGFRNHYWNIPAQQWKYPS